MEYPNWLLSQKLDRETSISYIPDVSLSNDLYWGLTATLEVSIGAAPEGITRNEIVTFDRAVDISIVSYIGATFNAVDTSLVTYTDAAIITAMDASLPLYKTKVNIDASFIYMGYNLAVEPSVNASFKNGDYYCGTPTATDVSLFFKANGVWLKILDASILFP